MKPLRSTAKKSDLTQTTLRLIITEEIAKKVLEIIKERFKTTTKPLG